MGKRGEGLAVAPQHRNGWARYFYPDGDGPLLYVRLGHDPEPSGNSNPAVVIREIWADFGGVGDRSRATRNMPLGRIEAAANHPSFYDQLEPYLSLVDGEPFPQLGSDWWTEPLQAKRRAPRLKLVIPNGRRKPDDFYRQVAVRFAHQATVSTHPSNDLAEANGVPVSTIHGWVKEARNRGVMPAASARRGAGGRVPR